MDTEKLMTQLEAIPTDDFEFQSRGLTEQWSTGGAGMECVEPILRFMENHPNIDYGMPGPLVHFIESRISNGEGQNHYVRLIIESIERRPTPHTVWVLNRLLNLARKTSDRNLEKNLLEAMALAKLNPRTDDYTRERIDDFLAHYARRAT
jgi:hypothetical protein